ncbi:MAG: thioredoxin-like domain-containing protein [Nibricoccus sp.]
MHLLRIIKISFLACLTTAATFEIRAEKWTTPSGVIEGKISGIYGTMAHIVGKKTMMLLPFDSLDDASLDQVAQYLATVPAEKPWAESTSPVAKATKGRLQILKDGKLVAFDPGTRAEPEFYVLYFSAHWCGPCRRFTPTLVQQYNNLRNRAFGEKCEVLFVSWDKGRSEQAEYVAEVQMPWLTVKFNADVGVLEKWKPNSIPGLAVVNRNGDIVFHSHEGGEYHGPTKPFQDLLALLREMEPTKAKYHQGRHRLAIRQQIVAGANQSVPAKVYFTPLDRKKFQGLKEPRVQIHCKVNEKGTVESFICEPALPPAYLDQSRQEIGRWLFLPAVENGKAQPQEVVVPVDFAATTGADASTKS